MMKIKKIVFIYYLTLLCSFNKSIQKVIFKQSDRVYIKLEKVENIPTDSFQDYELIFPNGQFKNTPSITYGTQEFDMSSDRMGYHITTISVTITKLNYRVQNLGKILKYLYFQVLAIDDPLIEIVNQTISNNDLSQFKKFTYQCSSPIQSISAFIVGFQHQGYRLFLHHYNYYYEFNQTYNIQFDMIVEGFKEIYYHYLIIYEKKDTNPYSSFYSYKQLVDKSLMQTEWISKTSLVDGSEIFFGLHGFLQKPSKFQGKISVLGSQLVLGNRVNIQYSIEGQHTQNSFQVQFMVMNCEIGEYMYLNEISKQFECTKSCSQIDHHYNNNPSNLQLLYKMSIPMCQICNNNCFGCVDGQPDNCLDCYNGKYLNPFNQKCEDTKPAETYCVQETVQGNTFYNCRECDKSCLECSFGGYKGCTKCKRTTAQLMSFLYKGQCTPFQPEKAYCLFLK